MNEAECRSRESTVASSFFFGCCFNYGDFCAGFAGSEGCAACCVASADDYYVEVVTSHVSIEMLDVDFSKVWPQRTFTVLVMHHKDALLCGQVGCFASPKSP